MKIAHIIGNGPSKAAFDPASLLPEIEDVFDCNLGTEGIGSKVTFIHDSRVFKHILKHKVKIPNHVITRRNYHKIGKECVTNGLFPSVGILPDGVNEPSSGHDALRWVMAQGVYKKIHLWGFDSLSRGIIDTDSKGKIEGSNPKPNKIPHWLGRFEGAFAQCKRKGKQVFLHYLDGSVEVKSDGIFHS